MVISPYKIARKILPASIQAELGNRHKVKRTTLDPMLFRFTRHPGEQWLHFEKAHTRNVPAAMLEQNPFIPTAVAVSFRRWYGVVQTQQAVKVQGTTFIEPTTGWPMGPGNQLYLSLYPSGANPYMPVPAYRAIWHKRPVVHFDKVISLRNVNEKGYSHFYTDLMAMAELIRQQGCDLKHYTLVISKNVAETKYGKFLLEQTPLFQSFGKIFPQDQEFVSCKEAIFANAFGNPTNNQEIFQQVRKQARAAHRLENENGERKIFLTRGQHRLRALRNNNEIVEIVRRRGFEMVDADRLSLPEQMELFANCRHLVGIHGAGLVNMLYRDPKRKLSLFEICEPLRPVLSLNAQYHNLATAMGFDYGATVGEDSDPNNQSFYMTPERFEKDFNAFCDAQ